MGGISGIVGIGSSTSANGQILFEIPGTYTWTAPSKATSVSVVCVGGGGGSRVGTGQTNQTTLAGSGGGALAYKNNIPIIPGNVYTVVVGAAGINDTIDSRIATNGGNSYFISNTLVFAGGGQVSKNDLEQNIVYGGEYIGDGGGNGGNGVSAGAYRQNGGGGGGAGGYTAPGGPGGGGFSFPQDGQNGLASTGGGGGGGAISPIAYYSSGGSGGGVGVMGLGANGFGGILQFTGPFSPTGEPRNVIVGGGAGGSSGGNSQVSLGSSARLGSFGGNAGYYGGGAGGTYNDLNSISPSYAGNGAVRIIWPGSTRQFPNTFTHDLYY